MRFGKRLASQLLTIFLVTILGGFVAAALVRYSPGYGTDLNDLDPRLSAVTVAALRAKRDAAGIGPNSSLAAFYVHYLTGVLHGDFGISQSYEQPISGLLLDRLPSTVSLVLGGSLTGWVLAFAAACLAVRLRSPVFDTGASAASGILLAFPPAVLALVFFYSQAPLSLAVGLILSPRLYSTLRILLLDLSRSDLLIAARARGIPRTGIALRYFARLASGRLAALFGIATVIAFGCAVPIEALCGHPGIGQLAWKAAQSRDLPLLSALALVVTVFVTCVNAAGDLLAPEPERQ